MLLTIFTRDCTESLKSPVFISGAVKHALHRVICSAKWNGGPNCPPVFRQQRRS
jgi:hypothetical protein